MVGSLFSADAWNSVTFIAGEIENPKRNVGLSLLLRHGNRLHALRRDQPDVPSRCCRSTASRTPVSDRVGVAAAQAIFGRAGTIVIAVLIMVSTFGCNNGLILSGARVYYTMAQEGSSSARAGTLNATASPAGACGSSALGEPAVPLGPLRRPARLRRVRGADLLHPHHGRDLRAAPHAARRGAAVSRRSVIRCCRRCYIVLATAICVLLLVYKPAYTWPGLIIVLLGVPIFYALDRRSSAATSSLELRAAFEYQALDAGGKTLKGVLEADTARGARAVAARARALGRSRSRRSPSAAPDSSSLGRAAGFSTSELALLARELATLVEAGRCRWTKRSPRSPTRARPRESARSSPRCARKCSKAKTLAQSLGAFPGSFPELFRRGVAAGESSGQLGTALTRLADYSESRAELSRTLIGALGVSRSS
jgi:hypothetical protein